MKNSNPHYEISILTYSISENYRINFKNIFNFFTPIKVLLMFNGAFIILKNYK